MTKSVCGLISGPQLVLWRMQANLNRSTVPGTRFDVQLKS